MGQVVGELGEVFGAGEAEVDDADAAVGADEGVAGLEVAVDDAELVSLGEAAGGLQVEIEDGMPGALALRLPGGEGGAGDELHGEEDLVADDADVVDRDDVGVGDAGEQAGLAGQALA
jgi:hypothetical protein